MCGVCVWCVCLFMCVFYGACALFLLLSTYSEYGTYTTKFRRSNCEILRRKHSVGAIPVINKFAEPVFTIFSPGFFQSPKQK